MERNKIMSTKDFVNECINQYVDNEDSLLEQYKEKKKYMFMNEGSEDVYTHTEKSINRRHVLNKFNEEVKSMLLSECIYKLYSEVLESELPSENNKLIARNLTNTFIIENGVDNLLRDFRTKNILLSEYNRIVTKYHKIVMEAVDKDNEDSLTIDKTVKDNFFDELDMVKPDDVILNIRTRVSDAVQEFIDSNTADKMEIKDIIQDVQNRVTTAKIDDVKESHITLGKRAITHIKEKPKNVLGTMVQYVAENVLKNEQLKQHYMNDSKLDMDKIVENTRVMYTFLELVNSTQMINVNEQYIKDVIEGIKNT